MYVTAHRTSDIYTSVLDDDDGVTVIYHGGLFVAPEYDEAVCDMGRAGYYYSYSYSCSCSYF